jgi:hypothetical protein
MTAAPDDRHRLPDPQPEKMENSTMSHRTYRSLAIGFATFLFTLSTAPDVRAQGYTEINQAVVDAAGGFPFTISASGLYRLTGNLTKTAADGTVSAIVIAASNVTLDLAGFTIGGPGSCARNATTGVVTCTGHVAGSGIQESGNDNVKIMNGTLRGFFNGISTSGTGVTVMNVVAVENAFAGISAIGDGSIVRFCAAFRNGTNGVTIQNHSQVRESDASMNDDYGISANQASAVVQNAVTGNRLGGMSLNPQTLFTQNFVLDNFGADPVTSGIDGGGNTCTNSAGVVVGC